MASKQRGEKRSKHKEDSLTRAIPERRFVSENAKVNFDSIRDTRKPILERGFEFERMECPDVYDNMCKRKWELFCKSPSLANLSLVNEFYANAIERKDYKVYVRGKTVSFDPKTINEHYGIQISRLENCYDIFEKNPDLDTISAMLCDGEIEWGRSKGPKRGFMSKCLSLQMTLWFLFISTRIMPGTHISEVTRERAILLHAILVEYKLDVGKMISKAIISCIDNSRIGLYFPSLISDLCIKALVPTSDDDEWKKPMNPIGSVAIKRIYTNKYEMGERIPSASTANQPRVPVNVSLSSRLARLEKNQKNWVNYQADYNEYQSEHMASMDGLLRGIASHLNMDVTQFPSTSNCPPSFRIEDEGESEEDEENSEGEERGDSDEDEDEGDRDDNIDED